VIPDEDLRSMELAAKRGDEFRLTVRSGVGVANVGQELNIPVEN
jgi:hypothetical protein